MTLGHVVTLNDAMSGAVLSCTVTVLRRCFSARFGRECDSSVYTCALLRFDVFSLGARLKFAVPLLFGVFSAGVRQFRFLPGTCALLRFDVFLVGARLTFVAPLLFGVFSTGVRQFRFLPCTRTLLRFEVFSVGARLTLSRFQAPWRAGAHKAAKGPQDEGKDTARS
ncbi:hypothetical protein ISCGN_003102 [Ixodes scapularis]